MGNETGSRAFHYTFLRPPINHGRSHGQPCVWVIFYFFGKSFPLSLQGSMAESGHSGSTVAMCPRAQGRSITFMDLHFPAKNLM